MIDNMFKLEPTAEDCNGFFINKILLSLLVLMSRCRLLKEMNLSSCQFVDFEISESYMYIVDVMRSLSFETCDQHSIPTSEVKQNSV